LQGGVISRPSRSLPTPPRRHDPLRTLRRPRAPRLQADALALDRARLPVLSDLLGLRRRSARPARARSRLAARRAAPVPLPPFRRRRLRPGPAAPRPRWAWLDV